MVSDSPFNADEVQYAMEGSQDAYRWASYGEKAFYKKDGTKIGVVKKRDNTIFICFRGTVTPQEALNDLNIKPASIPINDGSSIHLHKGFYDLYKSCEESMNEVIAKLQGDSKINEMVFTGHSAGAALSQIASLNHKLKTPNAKIKNIAFGGPRVFFRNGAQKYNKYLGSKTLLVQQNGDPVVHVPPPPIFSHAGYHRVKKAVTKKSLTTHQPPAYLNICRNITDDVLQTTHAKAIKIEKRMTLIQKKKSLGIEIRKDRMNRVGKALKQASVLNLKEAISIINDGSTRNKLRKKQKIIDKSLRAR